MIIPLKNHISLRVDLISHFEALTFSLSILFMVSSQMPRFLKKLLKAMLYEHREVNINSYLHLSRPKCFHINVSNYRPVARRNTERGCVLTGAEGWPSGCIKTLPCNISLPSQAKGLRPIRRHPGHGLVIQYKN